MYIYTYICIYLRICKLTYAHSLQTFMLYCTQKTMMHHFIIKCKIEREIYYT